MEFADKWAAIVWMCRNQLGRRNLTEEQRTYLIGKQYEAQKMTFGAADGFRGNQYITVKDQNDLLPKYDNTAQKVAADVGVAEPTVKRSYQFSQSVDEAEKLVPGFKESVLSGEIKAPKSVIREIKNVPEEKRANVVEAIKQGDIKSHNFFFWGIVMV